MLRYIACAWANQYTRIGYLFVFFGVWGLVITSGWVGFPLLLVGVVMLFALDFGKPTLRAYVIASKRLNRNGKISPGLAKLFFAGGYCVIVGAMLATKDFEKRSQEARSG